MPGKNLMDRISQGRQYRSFVEEVRVKDGEESFVVEGYAATFNEEYCLGENDYVRVLEKVDAGAFGKCDMSDTIFQYDHEGRVFARVSNGTLMLSADGHGLKVVADLGGTDEGRKLHSEIKGGYTNRMSFGFTVTAESEESRKGSDGKREYVRTILSVGRLYDVSAVSIPANGGTEISARKFVDGVINRLKSEEAERLAEDEKKNRSEEAERLGAKYRLMKTDRSVL